MRVTPELIEKVEKGELDLVTLVHEDLELYAELALKIKTKAGTILSFVFNGPQQIMHAWCENELAVYGRIRAVLVKARQWGGSTYVAGRLFGKCALHPNQSAKVIAHTNDHALALLGMYQRFYDMLPPELQPMKKYQSKSELTFANPSPDPKKRAENPGLNSALGVYSAGSQGAGRGTTLRGLHCSEVAFWDKADEIMLGLLNTVPSSETDGQGTEVFLESTANGVGNYFHSMYQRAKRGEGDFHALFIPWYVHPEYRTKAPVGFDKILTKYERELFEVDHENWAYDSPGTGAKRLSLDQIYWRRITLSTLCDNDPRRFQQEYPLTDDEAFLTSGAAFFAAEDVKDRIEAVAANVREEFRGHLEYVEGTPVPGSPKTRRRQRDLVPKLLDDEFTGNLRIWHKPEKGQDYVYFADVAEGVEGADYSVVEVLRRKDGMQCAEWRGYTDPDQLAQVCRDLGQYYNWAYGTPEAMAHGLVTLMRLKDLDYPYIYTRQVYDQTLNVYKDQEGWLTTIRTRPIMLEALRAAFRDGQVIVNSLEALSEMQTFTLQKGKLRAQDGCHDDCVMALAGACQMLAELPTQNKVRVKNWMGESLDGPVSRRVKSTRRTGPKYDRVTGAVL